MTALDRVMLAALSVESFNVDVVRSAWRALCERRRTAMREARRALEAAGQAPVYEPVSDADPLSWSHVKQLWTDHIIIEVGEDAATYRVSYTVSPPGTTVESVVFGTPTRVVETYVAASQALDMNLSHLSADELAQEWARLVSLAGSDMGMISLAGPPVFERKKLAHEGKALGDGSFPIPNVAYLKKAIKALGRAKDYDKALRHIVKRARELGQSQLVSHLKPKGSG
jgi:hypothetical protein